MNPNSKSLWTRDVKELFGLCVVAPVMLAYVLTVGLVLAWQDKRKEQD